LEFDSHEELDLSKQMKVIICSAFTQLTFGLRKHVLKHYKEILVVPRKYSYGNDVFYLGDVNRQLHRVTLAWNAVKRGFQIPDDAFNLCLHEFAHVLIFENRVSIIYYFFRKSAWENYKYHAIRKYVKIKRNEHEFLRDYAGSNLHELFSVAIEAFFERSHDFYAAEPELYLAMSELLGQDPRRLKYPLIKSSWF
jgi:Mlc titration factor MtfA (ptsG expression regulator)